MKKQGDNLRKRKIINEQSYQAQNIKRKQVKDMEKTFDDVLKKWLNYNRIRLKGGTINKYQNLIDTQINPKLGNIKISTLSTEILNSFVGELLNNGRKDGNGGLSLSYVRSIMWVVNSAIQFAVDSNWCIPIKIPPLKATQAKKEIKVLNITEQKKLESFLCENLTPTKIGIFISLCTGLRIGEICALRWENIDFKTAVLKVKHTVARVKSSDNANSKTKLIIDTPKTPSSVREIPISTVLLPILKKAYSASSSEYVVSECGSFTSPRTFEYRYHKLLKKCGISSVHYHALRHTFATRCIEAGVDMKSLSEILGHSNVGITMNTYVHSSMEQKRAQLEKLSVLSA